MPRRKQGTPQRLKLKASPALPGETEYIKNSQSRCLSPAVAEDFYASRNEVVTKVHPHALDSEKNCVSDDEKTVENTFESSEGSGEDNTTKETRSSCSFPTDFQDSIETMKKNNSKKSSVDRSTKGLDESQSANGEEGQGCRKTIREGEGYDVVATSPLHTLATAAAYKSPTPVHEPQNGTLSSSTNGKPPDMSMPIKKRAKRSPTPTSNSAAPPASQFPCDKQPRVSQGTDPSDVNNSDARLESFGPTTSSALSNQATPGDRHTPQLTFMEAMMQRQRQLYEECADNSWMSVQRSDNNCLSKSKAERYRWCVQENTVSSKTSRSSSPTNNKSSTGYNSHVTDLKKSTSLIGSTYPMQDKLYSTVFTGASKFRCRDCGSPFNTLVDLTVHMSKTGHYRDQNIDEMTAKGKVYSNKFAKPKKRSLMEMEEKDSAEKVLKCMGCGHSFDSLQDLSVHMIKTKHYQDVPSLRFFSQKNDLSNAASSVSHIKESSKALPVYPSHSLQQQQNNNNIATSGGMAEQDFMPENTNSPRTTPNRSDAVDVKMPDYPVPHMLGSIPSLANMQMMAAQSLLGFNPYLMPFGNGYCTTNSSFAAAAASLLFSAPWLSQLPNFGHAGMFSPFLHPHANFPTSMLNAGAMPSQPTPPSPPCTTSPFKTRGNDITKDERSSYFTQNVGIPRYGDDYQRSKSQILRCLECGESFSSLQKLTDHMQETTHFAKLSGPHRSKSPHPSESSSPKSRETEINVGASISQRSIYCPLGSSQNSNTPIHSSSYPGCSTKSSTASPLEHLAKLANGRSLDHCSSSSTRFNGRTDNNKSDYFRSSSSPHSPTSKFQTQFSNLTSQHREKYLSPLEKESSSKVITGFDFIKSLESTIQSAISKVKESPRSPVEKLQQQSSLSEQHQQEYGSKYNIKSQECRDLPPRSSFKPFTSSISPTCFNGKSSTTDSWSKLAKHTQESISTKNTHQSRRKNLSSSERPKSTSPPHQHSSNIESPNRRSASPRNPTSHTKTAPVSRNEKGYIALDLTKSKLPTLKDFDASTSKMRRHSESRLPLKLAASKLSEIKSEFPTGYSAKHSSKKEVVKSRATASPTEKSSYKFSPAQGDQQKTTNPLMEIQKIVNATELTRRPESMTDVAAKDDKTIYSSGNISTSIYHNRKRSSGSPKRDMSKRYKPGSVLSDLVTHDDDSEPTTNPLVQMEHLVNLRIGENSSPTIKTHSSNPQPPKRPVTNDSVASTIAKDRNCANPMSALLNFFEATNGLFRGAARVPTTTQPSHQPSRVSPTPNSSAKNNDMRIKAKFAKPAFKSNSSDQQETTSLPDETSKLRDKMADFFRSMVSNDRVHPEQSKRYMEAPSSPKNKRRRMQDQVVEVDRKTTSPIHLQQNENGNLKVAMDSENRGQRNEPIISKSIENTTTASLRPEQELYLQYYYVINFNRGEEDFKFNDLEAISRCTDLRPTDIKAWYTRTRQRLSEKNDCDFIRLSSPNGDGGATEANFLFSCTSGCEHFTEIASATEFLNHLRSHFDSLLNPALGKLNNSSDHKRPSSTDESGELERATKEWKMVYQGALRFGSYKSTSKDYSLTALVGESSALEGALLRSESPSSNDEVVTSTRHCADGLKVNDDSPIQVSG